MRARLMGDEFMSIESEPTIKDGVGCLLQAIAFAIVILSIALAYQLENIL